jgi:hypothetical protein
MRTNRHFAVLVAVLALVALAIPSLASAANTQAVPTRHLPASGATIRWTVMIRNAKTCRWGSSPEVAGFDGTVTCKPGRVVRPATFKANPSTGAKDYTLYLVMRGTARTVVQLKVVEAGTPASTTTTSTTTTTTTLPPASFPGTISTNWSGYVLTGGSGGYQAISADWTVPTLDCASVPNGYTSDWVGVNGPTGNPGLFQDGTTSGCVSGQQSGYAWFTDEALGYGATPSPTNDLFTVSPGDVIDAEVWQETSGYWAYYVSDLTSGSPSSAVEPFSGPGTTAEWIAEDPGCPNVNSGCWNNDGELQDLPDFGSVTFTDLGLTTPSGSWTVPPYSDVWEMVAPDGSVEALPSAIQGSGASTTFTVTYEPPGEMGSTPGTAAIKHAQSTFVAS